MVTPFFGNQPGFENDGASTAKAVDSWLAAAPVPGGMPGVAFQPQDARAQLARRLVFGVEADLLPCRPRRAGGAGVTDTIGIGIDLLGVRSIRAIIGAVAHSIAIAVSANAARRPGEGFYLEIIDLETSFSRKDPDGAGPQG